MVFMTGLSAHCRKERLPLPVASFPAEETMAGNRVQSVDPSIMKSHLGLHFLNYSPRKSSPLFRIHLLLVFVS